MKLITFTALLSAIAGVNGLTHAQAKARFDTAGITISSTGGCSDRTVRTCTSLDGVREATVAGAITLKRACNCAITVTGGTEVGHASGQYSHANGYKLDLRKDASSGGIDSYVKKSFTKIGDRSDGYPQWRAASGNIYYDEANHWDITFYQ